MAAPKGNKFGVGHGRPPKHFTDEQVTALGEEMLMWMEEQDNDPKSDVVHLSEWYSEVKGIFPPQWDDLTRRDSFSAYHKAAKLWMGKRLMKNKNLQSSYGNRFLGIYFSEIKAHEIEMMQIKNKTEDENKAEQIRHALSTMQQFKDQVSALNSADIKSSEESKS